MPEKANPTADRGGARIVADAVGAGDAENSTNLNPGEADSVPLDRTCFAMHHAACPICTDPQLLTLVRCVPIGLLRAMMLLLRAITVVRDDREALFNLPKKLVALLTPGERKCLAYAALKSLDPEARRNVIEAVAQPVAGWPPP